MSTTIYILRLVSDKYYVGKSNHPSQRYKEHLAGTGSAWTRRYQPIGVERIIQNASPFDEDKYTKMYMAKYGINNVRGGSYVEMVLDDDQLQALHREIWGAQNKCTRCGRGGHFVQDCFASHNINGDTLDDDSESEEEVVWCCEKCDAEFDSESGCARHEMRCQRRSNTCYRCGRDGHFATDCYALRHVKGWYI